MVSLHIANWLRARLGCGGCWRCACGASHQVQSSNGTGPLTPVKALKDRWAGPAGPFKIVISKEIEGEKAPGALSRESSGWLSGDQTSPHQAGCAAEPMRPVADSLEEKPDPQRARRLYHQGGPAQGLLAGAEGLHRGVAFDGGHHPNGNQAQPAGGPAAPSLDGCRLRALKQLELCAGRRERKGSQGWEVSKRECRGSRFTLAWAG